MRARQGHSQTAAQTSYVGQTRQQDDDTERDMTEQRKSLLGENGGGPLFISSFFSHSGPTSMNGSTSGPADRPTQNKRQALSPSLHPASTPFFLAVLWGGCIDFGSTSARLFIQLKCRCNNFTLIIKALNPNDVWQEGLVLSSGYRLY